MRLIAMEIFQFCGDYSIVLKVHWIPRSEIDRADYISRIIDVDDWKMPAACFASLDTYLGGRVVHTVNCFARFYDKKIGKCFSRLWDPGCNGVDFFVQNLVGEDCLVVPPVSFISRALHYLYGSKATATLVVPLWPSSYF